MSNKRLEHDLGLCVKYKVPIVISSLGAVPEVNAAIHSYGGIVLHDVINNRHANSAIRKGADGLIAVATGAGGHAGTLSPFALVQEIREWFDGPLLLAGAIANGGSILAAQAMGADMAYIGSPFIATREARATEAYKQAIVEAHANDIVYSNYFTGVHGNYLKASIVASGLDPDNLPVADPSKMDFAAASTGAKAWKDIWGAGQGVGAVKAIEPVSALVDRLARSTLRRSSASARHRRTSSSPAGNFQQADIQRLKSCPNGCISPPYAAPRDLRRLRRPL